MSNRQIVEDLLQRIPEGASLQEIAREIEFIDAVRKGLAELDRGETIPIEDVESEMPSWIINVVDHVRHVVEVARFWHAARGTPEIGN